MTLTAKYANNAKDRAGNVQLGDWFRVARVVRGSWTQLANWSTHNYYHADGNGNITYLVNGSQGLATKYRYDPYGNAISQSGSLSFANVYRFSSKEFHSNSGLYYYGYRFYHPNLQRWLNRDPLGEPGFETLRRRHSSPARYTTNVYSFVGNDPMEDLDPNGLILFGRIGGLLNKFVCPKLGGTGCQLCCALTFLGQNIADDLEAGLFGSSCEIGTVTLGTPACIAAMIADLIASHALNISDFKDCLDSCPKPPACNSSSSSPPNAPPKK